MSSLQNVSARTDHARAILVPAYRSMQQSPVRVALLNNLVDGLENMHRLPKTFYNTRSSSSISYILSRQLGNFRWQKPATLYSDDFYKWCLDLQKETHTEPPSAASVMNCYAVALQAFLLVAPAVYFFR